MIDQQLCTACGHLSHGERCPHPIAEDILVGDSAYSRTGRFYRSVIVDTCNCKPRISA